MSVPGLGSEVELKLRTSTPGKMPASGEIEAQTMLAEKLSQIVDRLEVKTASLENVVKELAAKVETSTNAQADFDTERFKKEKEIEIAVKEKFSAWRNLPTRKSWLLSGVKPSIHGGKFSELQESLMYKAKTTREVTAQMAQMSGFDVSDFMPDCPTLDPATVSLVEQMEIFADVIMIVIKGVECDASLKRRTELFRGLQRGVDIVREHTRKRPQLIKVEANKEKMISLVNEDLRTWSSELFHAATLAGAEWVSPPDIDSLPPVTVPAWTQNQESGTVLDTERLLSQTTEAIAKGQDHKERGAVYRPGRSPVHGARRKSSLDATRVGQPCPESGVYEAIRLLEATFLCLVIDARARWPLQATRAIETYSCLSRDEANAAEKCTRAVGTMSRGHDVVARAGLKERPSCGAVYKPSRKRVMSLLAEGATGPSMLN
eukprot:jgi/Undpi1/4167/HiC_scaffold_16.g07534.m1